MADSGFTLIELIMVIVVLGILAVVATPKIGSFTQQSKINATKEEMRRIKIAIIGDSRIVSGSEYIDRGFQGDIGIPPSRLQDLVSRPDSIQTYDKFTRMGWNGPYLDSAGQDYLKDAWGNLYVYSAAARTITSTSISPAITIGF